MRIMRFVRASRASIWGIARLELAKRLLELDPQVCNDQQTTGYKCDEFQTIPSLLFLSCVDLRECSLSGSVDEFVRGMFDASIA
jgi:hypothetical protein